MIIPQGQGGTPQSIVYTQIALYHYNNSKDADFEFVEVDHRNIQVVQGCMNYITFKAKTTAGSIQMFQAKVLIDIVDRNGEFIVEVLFCRVKPSEGSGGESHLEKPRRTEKAAEPEGKQVVLEEVIDVLCLDRNYEWLGNRIVAYDKAYNFYCKQILDSKGFYVNRDIPLMFAGQIMPLDTRDLSRNLVPIFSEIALSHYVDVTSEDKNLEFEGIENANAQTNSCKLASMPFKAKVANFYITFTVKNKDTGSTMTLQTLVWKRALENGRLQIKVIFVRLMPTCKGK